MVVGMDMAGFDTCNDWNFVNTFNAQSLPATIIMASFTSYHSFCFLLPDFRVNNPLPHIQNQSIRASF